MFAGPYVGILLLFAVSALFVIVLLALSSFLGPKVKTPAKEVPFECGATPVDSVQEQRFNVRFYLVAVIFILFDVEVVFLYPWAVALEELGWFAFAQMLLFLSVLGIGLYYIWRKGVFDWN